MTYCNHDIICEVENSFLQSCTISFEYMVKRNSRPYTMTYFCYENHDIVKFIKKRFCDDLEIVEKYPVKLYNPSLKKLLNIAGTVKNRFNVSPIFFFALMHPKHDEFLSFLRCYYIEIVPTNSETDTGLFLSLQMTENGSSVKFKEILIGNSHDYDKDLFERTIFPHIMKKEHNDTIQLCWRIKSKDAGNYLKSIFMKSGLVFEYSDTTKIGSMN